MTTTEKHTNRPKTALSNVKQQKPIQSNNTYLDQLQQKIEIAIRESDTSHMQALSYANFVDCILKLGYNQPEFTKNLWNVLIVNNDQQQMLSCATAYDALLVLIYNGRRSELNACFSDYLQRLHYREADQVSQELIQMSIDELCSMWRHTIRAKTELQKVKPQPALTSKELKE